MTKAALTKLLLLVILAFIICLPEFFTLHRVLKVNFKCKPCEQGNQVEKREDGRPGNAEDKRTDICDPPPTPDHVNRRQICTPENESILTELVSGDGEGGDKPKMSWFMCETDKDMTELYSNVSSSDHNLLLKVSVEFQLNSTEYSNLTLYGHGNHSSLHLHPPEDEEREMGDDDDDDDDDSQREAFFCCLPLLPAATSSNRSQCLLWLANQTLLTATLKEKLPWKLTDKDEWLCMFRVAWLALLCVVFLAIVTTVIGQIYREKKLCKKPKVRPAVYDINRQLLKDGEKQTNVVSLKGTTLELYESQAQSELSIIQEVESDVETVLDGIPDHCYTGKVNVCAYKYHKNTF
ncbi:uncharacterized protein LOC133451170 isoform X1 [Cololabis saira]|uniref:uncharacterized protein LOC133451170 isoform X1 n=1 Tax=Cololabis saira TaxID=129043 RepID=UPI002AD23605|nr:uncharacterized protein LOC133451170 isoform X1 [Cololabis saira]